MSASCEVWEAQTSLDSMYIAIDMVINPSGGVLLLGRG
jgi:hypothetical protein